MQAFYKKQSANIRKTWGLMTFFLVLVIVLGFFLSSYYGNVNFLYGAIVFSLLMNVGAYWFSDSIVLLMANANPIEKKDEYPELWSVVENLSKEAGLPMPKLYIINDPAPNAFATGRNKEHAVIAVTTGLLPLLSRSELEGVIAHELSHIGNRDMLLQSVVVVFAGIISFVANMALHASMFSGRDERRNPIFSVLYILAIILAPIAATIIRLAISREREYLADSTGVLITKYPEGLATALEKISNFHQPMKVMQPAIAHLFISDPTGLNGHKEGDSHHKVTWLERLFMTHPPAEDRIARLLDKKTPM